MNFRAEEIDTFRALFAARKDTIRAFPGCQHLALLQDVNHPNIFFTYSHWDSEQHLKHYRYSEFFKETWGMTKALFADKAEAWSLDQQASL